MRRVFKSSVRGVAAVVVTLVLAGSASAIQREGRPQRDRVDEPAIVKLVKKMIRALGDGLTIPRP